jgi:hypothetical protein
MPAAKRLRGPILLIVASVVAAIALNFGFTAWAIGYHSKQACSELHILATMKGAITAYDQGIRHAYERLYALRCG